MRVAAPEYVNSMDSDSSASSSPPPSTSYSSSYTRGPTPRNVFRAFPSLDSSDSFSSDDSSKTQTLARKARQKTFEARDKVRKKKVKGKKSRRGHAGSSKLKSSSISPEGSSGPIKRSLTFIYDNFVPYFNISDCPTPSGSFSNAPGAYPGSFNEPAAGDASPSGSSGSESERNVSDNYDTSFDGSDSSNSSYSPASDSTAYTSVNCSSSDLTSEDTHTHTPSSQPRSHSRGSPNLHASMDPSVQAQYDREGAKIDKARARAKEAAAERRRKTKRKEMEAERAMRQKEAARFAREQAEECAIREAEKLARAEEFAKRHPPNIKVEEDDSPPRFFGDWRPFGHPQYDESTGGIKQEEEGTRNFYPRDPPKETEYVYTSFRRFGTRSNERTSRTRSSHQHFHPYASSASAKFGSFTSGRYFNPTTAATLSPASAADPLVAHFEWYKQQWADISSLRSNAPLRFHTIPWPTLTIPRNARDVTKAAVTEFMRHALLGPNLATAKQVRSEVMRQLKNWHSDKFTTRVLPRVKDKKEREVIRAAMDVVQKALVDLKSA